MHIEFKRTAFGKTPVIIKEDGDTKKAVKKAESELPTFILVNGFFGKKLSDEEFITEWSRNYG